MRKLLILDLDGTLIGPRGANHPRPGLQRFLRRCFRHFRVAVWSAADADYVNEVINTIFPNPERLLFAWSGRRCVFRRDSWENNYTVFKPLAKVWRAYPEWNRTNTLILDDTPSTYMRNHGNAIPIHSWIGHKRDRGLSQVWGTLRRKLELEDVRRDRTAHPWVRDVR